MSKIVFLSYPLNDKAFGYGNSDRFKLNQVRDMSCGDTSNNSAFQMPSHYGTHIDYPFHFSTSGKKSSDYKAEHFVFSFSACVEINSSNIENYLIKNSDLNLEGLDENLELLFIKTGYCNKRYTQDYWEFGLGFHPETADYLKQKLPKLKVIAFDLISLNSYQQREKGREAHKEFLNKNDILIVEDVDLTNITSLSKFDEVIIAPLLIDNADGAPVTIIAKIR